MAAQWFAERLKELREQRELNQGELAEKIGVHRETVVRWESGAREPSWASVVLLCDALQVDCSAFLEPPKKGKR